MRTCRFKPRTGGLKTSAVSPGPSTEATGSRVDTETALLGDWKSRSPFAFASNNSIIDAMTGKRIAWAIIAAAAGVVILVFFLTRAHRLRPITEAAAIPIEGAVIQRDADPNKELPIAAVAITASDGVRTAKTESDAAGYFHLVLQKGVLSDRPVTVAFRHPNYKPLDLTVQTGRLAIPKQLYVAAMVPLPTKAVTRSSQPLIVVSNIRVRYTINTRTETNIASEEKTFQVVNKGNVPRNRQSPCSPDGKWKATS